MKKSKEEKLIEDTQTPYEYRLYKRYEKTEADLLKDSKMTRSVLKQALAMESSVELENGEYVYVPKVVQLVGKKIAYWEENPKEMDIEKIAKVLGEVKDESNVTITNAAEIFGGLEATGINSEGGGEEVDVKGE